MALADLARGKTPEEALEIKDQQVFSWELIEIPDQKQHCIRLAVKNPSEGHSGSTGEST